MNQQLTIAVRESDHAPHQHQYGPLDAYTYPLMPPRVNTKCRLSHAGQRIRGSFLDNVRPSPSPLTHPRDLYNSNDHLDSPGQSMSSLLSLKIDIRRKCNVSDFVLPSLVDRQMGIALQANSNLLDAYIASFPHNACSAAPPSPLRFSGVVPSPGPVSLTFGTSVNS